MLMTLQNPLLISLALEVAMINESHHIQRCKREEKTYAGVLHLQSQGKAPGLGDKMF